MARSRTLAEADDTVVQLHPMPKEIAGQEAGLFQNQGQPLAPRPPNYDDKAADSDVAIDLGTGNAVYLKDGNVTSDIPGFPYIKENGEPPVFGENLAITLGLEGRTLDSIGADVIQGVDADTLSRQSWIEQYNKGIDLLGLKIEELTQRGGVRRNISRVGHPLMLEAMVKYQAGAAAEMLPAMGPAKVPTIGKVPDDVQLLANAFEADLNYFLTDVAKEYYPDTGRMLMHQAFCGLGYKKVFRCPIRRRPVSESVLAPDLIVSEEATDLDNALRVTHRIDMLRGTMKRMQIVGQYRDIDLGMPGASMQFGLSAQRKIRESDGLTTISLGRPEDAPYEILEVDQDIDIDEHMIDGYWERRTPDGLPLPYKIAVERSSQRVLGIWRNWRKDDQLCLKRNMYVKFGMVPGLGFHDWGFLQLLGNQTRALRAIWRLLIDCGMLSNFPGGIKNKNIRTMTNEIMPAPGEFVDVDAPLSADLTKQFVPMPYKDVSATLVQFQDMVKQESQQLAGLVLAESGEGRTNIPVGTIMAFVEDKIQVMAQVYKRNHQAQKEEFNKLRELFAENPRDLWTLTRDRPTDPNAARQQWSRAEEFTNLNLRPASDPNVPSRIHRLMVDNVLAMLAQQAPMVFDIAAVVSDIVSDLGKDPQRYIVQPGQGNPPPPDPKIQAANIQQQMKGQELQAKSDADDKKLQLEREKMSADVNKAAAQNETAQQVEQIKQQASGDKANADAAGQYQLENLRQQHENNRQLHQTAHEQSTQHNQNMSDFLHQQHQTAADQHKETVKHGHTLEQQAHGHAQALEQAHQQHGHAVEKAALGQQINPANQQPQAPAEEPPPEQPPGGMGGG